MARTHARVKGKSGSTKPAVADLSFVTLKKEEAIKLIVDMAKDDVSLSVIGLKLRDTYGVPSVKKLVGSSISQILKDNKIESSVPEDLNALVVKAKALKTSGLRFIDLLASSELPIYRMIFDCF